MNNKQKIIQKFELQNLDQLEQDEEITRIVTTTLRNCFNAIISELDDNQVQQLSALIDQGDDQAYQWLEKNIPEFDNLFETQLNLLRDNTLGSIEDLLK